MIFAGITRTGGPSKLEVIAKARIIECVGWGMAGWLYNMHEMMKITNCHEWYGHDLAGLFCSLLFGLIKFSW